MPLTDTYIRSLKAADREQKHFDGGGLYLSIPKTGRKLGNTLTPVIGALEKWGNAIPRAFSNIAQ